MARTRSTEKVQNFKYFYVSDNPNNSAGQYDKFFITKSESITDNNNKTQRPESGVSHYRTTSFPGRIPDYTIPGLYFLKVLNEPLGADAKSVKTCIDSRTSQGINEAFKELQFKFYQERASLVDRKDTINFLAELKELPSLFKSLNKYRYLDWEFGMAPFLRELTGLLSITEDTLESAKGKIASSQKYMKFEKSKIIPVSFDDSRYNFGAGFPCRVKFDGKCSVRLRGEYRVIFPDITNDSNLKALIRDIEGFNADPATIWEALPFSWLIDWFLPIGSYLEKLSGSNFNPVLVMRGTITVKCTGSFEVFTAYNHQYGAFKAGHSMGGGSYLNYSRTSFSDSLDSMFHSPPKWRFQTPDFRKSGILNDIFGKGSSLDDAKKSKHQLRKAIRRKKRITRIPGTVD